MIDWRAAQRRLGVEDYGDFGPVSYRALIEHVAGRAVPIRRDLALALTANAMAFGIEDNAYRLAGFVGQTCHESGGFRYLREIWGPTEAQRGYEGRASLGNTKPGDGKRFMGRGLIQITGRANYGWVGRELGLDLEARPELAEQPTTAVLTALVFWKARDLNALCDHRDWQALTRRINGGTNGAAERLRLISRALEVLE